MATSISKSPLHRFVAASHPVLHAKLLEVRETVERWLAYIPQTFPHYTRHTIEHSDELIRQASKLLFIDEDATRPVVALSAMEAYLIAVSAYLHDSGMVTSDHEKSQILKSEMWREWVTSGSGSRRWREIEDFRRGSVPPDDSERHFLADVQVRFLIAEFVRQRHHLRAGDVIHHHQAALARFAFDDPLMIRTIAHICVAHGLLPHELDDPERYPERRDVRGELVNVKFAAIILRLADLLDMTTDRACPLLLNAACPLPPDSLAHWSQYHCITHRLTAHDEIAIIAECQTQAEHRVLQDWCQWIVDEIRNARVVMARSSRHGTWSVPRAGFEDPEATISIRPGSTANYIPSRWMFQLDRDAVFERLIHDVYENPLSFVRELIQNGLDATRCQLYTDLTNAGLNPPSSPTAVGEEWRGRYPVEVVLQARQIENELSGEAEIRHVVTVNDYGIGMDRDVIAKYLLQVGRSFYVTEQFRRSYNFVPSSQFGVGFLSVFGVSDHVTVETNAPSSSDGPIRLVLTGHRNYLLTEKGRRRRSGTSVEVVLREQLPQGRLTQIVAAWCRRVEFPIIVNEFGQSTTIRAEASDQFTYEEPDVTDPAASFFVRAFPVDRSGIEGEIYVFGSRDAAGEHWAILDWARYIYEKRDPRAIAPKFVESITCFQGLAIGDFSLSYNSALAIRVDFRGPRRRPVLSRARLRGPHAPLDPELLERCDEIVREHLVAAQRAQGENGWKYKQRLIRNTEFLPLWEKEPGTIRAYFEGISRLVSLQDIRSEAKIVSVAQVEELVAKSWRRYEGQPPIADVPPSRFAGDDVVLLAKDLEFLSAVHHKRIFDGRAPTSAQWLPSGHLAIDWVVGAVGENLNIADRDRPMFQIPLLHDREWIGCEIHYTTSSTYGCMLLNAQSAFVQWLVRVKHAAEVGQHGLSISQFKTLLGLFDTPIRYGGPLSELTRYLGQWSALSGLPPELYPPVDSLTPTALAIPAALRQRR